MPVPVATYHTVEQVLALPDDGQRRELAYGELLVSPAPSLAHQRVVTRLLLALHAYLQREPVGEAFVAPADLTWGRPDLLVQPDVFVVDARDGEARTWGDIRHVALIAEVLSPATRQHDRFRKRVAYRDRGVPTYWILDPLEGPAEVWTPGAAAPELVPEVLTWHPSGAGTPFSIRLDALRA